MMLQDFIIETNDLTKIYKVGGEKLYALNEVSIRIKRGEMIAIVGPSGSGKSTLMHIIGGLDKPTSGQIKVNSKDISKFSSKKFADYRNKTIGFVFQNFNLIPSISVLENVKMPLYFSKNNYRNSTKKVLELLEKLGIADKIKNKPNELSGGQKQRVAIARALVNDPQIILADEPTGNLDSKTGREVLEILKNLNKNNSITILIVTHDINIASECHRIIKMKDGMIVEN
ncbi:MAG: ABC transporter ATP-binding protein [Candidatus Dojkabacteria bacterium]|nr:ABC transporter ATP-binding protein [Candidatus Dojkabacteria bacterium]